MLAEGLKKGLDRASMLQVNKRKLKQEGPSVTAAAICLLPLARSTVFQFSKARIRGSLVQGSSERWKEGTCWVTALPAQPGRLGALEAKGVPKDESQR